jgi:hypothetical protein
MRYPRVPISRSNSFGGYVGASHFVDEFRRAESEPDKQPIFLRGGCAPPVTAGPAARLKSIVQGRLQLSRMEEKKWL